MGNEMCLPLAHGFETSFTQINLSGVSLEMRTRTHVLYPPLPRPSDCNQNFSRVSNTKLHENPFTVRDLSWANCHGDQKQAQFMLQMLYNMDDLRFCRETMGDTLMLLLTAMLPTLSNARNIPYVPAVVYPPTPQEGKYEQHHDTKCVITAFWKSSGKYTYHQVARSAILRSAHTVYLCGSENKQRLFP